MILKMSKQVSICIGLHRYVEIRIGLAPICVDLISSSVAVLVQDIAQIDAQQFRLGSIDIEPELRDVDS